VGDDKSTKGRKVKSRDIPGLLEALTCSDVGAQAETLTLLCPCRNVRYDKEVWAAIFHASVCSEDRVVRDRAEHAIGTLRERAQIDPRSQELVRWLIDQGLAPSSAADVIPVWKTGRKGFANGLIIPQYEAPARSRHRRQRR